MENGSNPLINCMRRLVTTSNTLSWLANHTRLVLAKPFQALEIGLKF